MNDEMTVSNLLEATAKVLIRCVIIQAVIMVVWVILFFLLGDFVYKFHAGLSGISQQNFVLLNYYGLIFWKCIVMLFLIPYISIRMVLNKNK